MMRFILGEKIKFVSVHLFPLSVFFYELLTSFLTYFIGNGVKPTQYPLQQQIIHNCDQPIYKVQNFTFFKENPNYKIADNQKMDHASYFMLKVLECPCRRNCKSTKDVIVRLCVDGAEVKFTFKECERC